MVIADQMLVKKINQKVLLNEIVSNSPISRASLSEKTGLNKSTVSSQISTLIEKNLIFEIGQGQSSGGRKPVMLLFNKNAGFSIGIDVGVDDLNGILSDLKGNIVLEDHQKLDNPNVETIKNQLCSMINSFINQMPDSPYGLIGIGLGVPGLVNNEHQITLAPNLNWYKDIDLKKVLEQEFQVPVFIENEANAGAHGEKEFGAAKDYQNLVFVSVGTGIGTGIIINNELYRGDIGFAGEMGHLTIDLNGPKCRCGNRGCWELYASEKAMLNSQPSQLPKKSKQEIINLANQNDPEILSALQNFGYYLGVGLVNVLNTFNPQAVVVRNDIIEALPIVLNSLRNSISSRINDQLGSSYELLLSSLGKNATAMGASSLVIEHFLENVST
ncbi:ROK family transcriptional regulator [Neobacillus cucumis]|uniref:ROK family transcriptional regulator n=1 Tax=Neobacillus cucumis TaxID=1740721 RepID=UPI001965FE1B|nr:ROK family transcriptional regulator [Neobacillus cucumis]MBM7654987.1 putative NBD/HSP70 family sugar kinase [Neobacillus cucumis]MED4226297.1 ROK family transcriptional regulator [Neobacillus cucumis]